MRVSARGGHTQTRDGDAIEWCEWEGRCQAPSNDRSEVLLWVMKMPRSRASAPTVFISYSWESSEHRDWVRDLAARLRADGVETTLDQWHAVPGDQLPQFMEREIR